MIYSDRDFLIYHLENGKTYYDDCNDYVNSFFTNYFYIYYEDTKHLILKKREIDKNGVESVIEYYLGKVKYIERYNDFY